VGRGVHAERESPEERGMQLIEGWVTSFLFMQAFPCTNFIMRYGIFDFRDAEGDFMKVRNDRISEAPRGYISAYNIRVSRAAR